MTSHLPVNSSIIDEIDRLSLAYQKAKDYVGQISTGLDQQIDTWTNRRQIIQMETSPSYDYLLPKTQRINELLLEAVEALCRVELLVEQITRIDPKFLHVTRSNENRVELPRSFYPNSSSIDSTNVNGKSFDSTTAPPMTHPPGFQPAQRSPVSVKTHFKPVVQAPPQILTPSASPSKFTPVHRPTLQYAPTVPPPGLSNRQDPSIPSLMSQSIPNYVQSLPRLSSRVKEKVKLQRIAGGMIWKQAQITVVDSLSGFCVQNWEKNVKNRFDRLIEELHQTYDTLEKSNQLVLPETIEIGDFGVAKCSEDQQWHRARVIMCEGVDQIRIVFIDFGFMEVKSVGQFFPLDKYFTSLPAQAIACSLSEASPQVYDDDQSGWSMQTIEIFKNEVLNRIVELHFVNRDQNTESWPLHFVRVVFNNQLVNSLPSLRQHIYHRENQFIAEQLAGNLREQEYILFNIPITDDELEQ